MFISEKATWYRPTTLKQLLELNTTHPDAKLIGGNYEQSETFSWMSVTASLSLGCQSFIYFFAYCMLQYFLHSKYTRVMLASKVHIVLVEQS